MMLLDRRQVLVVGRGRESSGRPCFVRAIVLSGFHVVSVDDLQERLSITRELDLADAGDGSKLCNRPWTARGHFRKRFVVEDDIGWYVLRLGQLQPFGAQLLEKSAVGGGKCLRSGKCLLRLATSGFPFWPGLLQGAQAQGRLLAQELAAFRRDGQASLARHVHCDQPMRDELADNRAPGIAVVLVADAESGELVMAQAPGALVVLAQENRDDMRLPEALAGA